MKTTFILIFFFISNILNAQVKPSLLPEDLHVGEMKVRCFCKPGVINKSRSKGVKLSYSLLGNGTYKKEDNNNFTDPLSSYKTLQFLEFSLKAPVLIKESFKLLVGYKYVSEVFDFKQVGADFSAAFQELDSERLKSNSLTVIASKSFDEKSYAVVRLSYSSDGDYDTWMSFENKYAISKFYGLYARKPDDNFEWGIGIAASKSFRRSGALPFILLNKNFSPKWGIESVLPVFVFGRYNIDPSNIFLFGVEYDSQSYRMDISDSQNELAYAYNHSEIMTSVRLEHQFTEWIWGNVKLGYQFNLNSEFEQKNDLSTTFTADPTDALFLKIGVFVSPPDSFK